MRRFSILALALALGCLLVVCPPALAKKAKAKSELNLAETASADAAAAMAEGKAQKMTLPIKGDVPQEWKDLGQNEYNFEVHMSQLTEEEKSEMTHPPHWRCNACQGAAHMIVEHIRLATLYDPIANVNLTKPRKLTEGEVIDTVEKLCTDTEKWGSFGAIGLKNGMNFFWGPGIDPPPATQQVQDKHHTTSYGEIFKYRMKQTCAELVGIHPEEDWYTDFVLKNKTGIHARKKVCNKKGQACDKHNTMGYIVNFLTPDQKKKKEEAILRKSKIPKAKPGHQGGKISKEEFERQAKEEL